MPTLAPSPGAVESVYRDRDGRVLEVIRGNPDTDLDVWRDGPVIGDLRVVGDRPRSRPRSTAAPARNRATSRRPTTDPFKEHIRGPIRNVIIDGYAVRGVCQRGETFDGNETAFAAFGYRLSDDTIQISSCVDVSESRQRGSVRLDRQKWADATERVSRISGMELVGDVHVEPTLGLGNPSKSDLRWWKSQLDRQKLDAYVGVIVNRDGPADSSWNYPRWTAFSCFRDTDGAFSCDLILPEVDPTI